MPLETDKLLEEIKKTITAMTAVQADVLAKRLSAAFVLGFRRSGTKVEISDLQRNAIKKIAAENLGYINEFNAALGKQLEGRVKELIAEGKGYDQIKVEVRPFVEGIFNNKETVNINHVGQTRLVLDVNKDGLIVKIDKLITQEYTSTIENYSKLLSRTAVHQAYEKGRAAGYQASGFKRWRFTGPVDERSRTHHIRLVGEIFEYGTEQSNLAEQVLQEINCRHRAIPVFEEEHLNTPQEFYIKQREKAGLYFDETAKAWAIKE